MSQNEAWQPCRNWAIGRTCEQRAVDRAVVERERNDHEEYFQRDAGVTAGNGQVFTESTKLSLDDNAERGRGSGLPAGCLLSVGLSDLTDKLGPAHVHGAIDLAGLGSPVILEDFHHQGRVVRDDDARL